MTENTGASDLTQASADKPSLQTLEDYFHQIAAYALEERAAMAQALCGNNPELLRNLLALLDHDARVDELPASDGRQAGIHSLDPRDASDEELEPWVGRSLGPYTLEKVLGRGGMGVVYLGTRKSRDLSQGLIQNVAVKIMASFLNSAPAVSQFLLEREALSKLEHAHVARLLDGGVEQGVPYLVMEYVDGRSLDVACDDPACTTAKKMQYVLQLCEAVDYVHRNLVLHRDLKPGNVLVTSEGAVKLLDFGTIKMLSPELEDSAMTRAGMRSVTLRYASPEYLEGKPLTTASDVYSLGMILYRIMAGRLPVVDANRGISAYIEDLKHEPFHPPSEVLRNIEQNARDLDAIIAKALRFEAAERYQSVRALADDLTKALNNRPVNARQGNLRYYGIKFYQRHQLGIAGALMMITAMALGTYALLHEGRVARVQTQRAEAGVSIEGKLAHALLFNYFEELKKIPGSTDAQRKAVAQAISYLDALSGVTTDPHLQLDTIHAYTKLGALQGSPYEENIGDVHGAITTLDKAVALSHGLLRDQPDNIDYLEAYAAAQEELGGVYLGDGDPKHAIRPLQSAADTSLTLVGKPEVPAQTLAHAASMIDGLADGYYHDGTPSLELPLEATEVLKQSQDVYKQCLSIDPGYAACRRGIAVSDYKLGLIAALNDQSKAAVFFTNGLATLATFPIADQSTPRLQRVRNATQEALAKAYVHTGRAQEGVAMLRQMQARDLASTKADPVDTRARFDLVAIDSTLADGYEMLSKHQLELGELRHYVEDTAALSKLNPTNDAWTVRYADALLWYGRILTQTGEAAAGRQATDHGLEVILPIANKPDAAQKPLTLAASYLLSAHRGESQDAPLALSFIKRAVASEKDPAESDLLILAEAQCANSLLQDCHDTAQSILKKGSFNDLSPGQVEEAQRLAVVQVKP